MGITSDTKMKFFFCLIAGVVLCGKSSTKFGVRLPGWDPEGAAPTWDDIQKRIDENPVIIFSASYCGWSRMAKDHLARLNIPFVYQEINQDDYHYLTRSLFERFSPAKMRSTPRIFINGEDLRGASDLERLGDAKILEKFN